MIGAHTDTHRQTQRQITRYAEDNVGIGSKNESFHDANLNATGGKWAVGCATVVMTPVMLASWRLWVSSDYFVTDIIGWCKTTRVHVMNSNGHGYP